MTAETKPEISNTKPMIRHTKASSSAATQPESRRAAMVSGMPFSPASQRTSKTRPSGLLILRCPWDLARSRVNSGGAPIRPTSLPSLRYKVAPSRLEPGVPSSRSSLGRSPPPAIPAL